MWSIKYSFVLATAILVTKQQTNAQLSTLPRRALDSAKGHQAESDDEDTAFQVEWQMSMPDSDTPTPVPAPRDNSLPTWYPTYSPVEDIQGDLLSNTMQSSSEPDGQASRPPRHSSIPAYQIYLYSRRTITSADDPNL